LVLRPNGLFGKPGGSTSEVSSARRISISLPQTLLSAWAGCLDRLRAIPPGMCVTFVPLVAAAMPWIASDYLIGVISLAFVWSIAAISLNIVMGYGGMPSLGHAAFFGLGAYFAAAGAAVGLGGFVSILAGSLVGALSGLAMALASLRAKHAHLLLVTLAFGQVLWGIVFKWRSVTGGDDGFIHSQRFEFPRGFGHSVDLYFAVLLVFLVVMAIFLLFARSRYRLVLEGIRSNEKRMLAFGYHVDLCRIGAFVFSGALGAIAGGAYAIYSGFVSPDLFGINTSAKILLMTIVGGAGTFFGPVIGAFGLLGIEEILSSWTARWMTALGVIYIVVAMATRIRFKARSDSRKGLLEAVPAKRVAEVR